MNRYFLILLLLISFTALFAQEKNDTLSVQELIKKGIELHDDREYKQAIEIYNEALKIDTSSMYATYELALSYLALRDYENANKYSSKVINSPKDRLHIGAYGVKSETLAKTGKADEAIKLLESAINKHGNDYYLHFNLALNYYNQGELDKTILHVDNALNLDKTQSGAYLLSAYALKDKEAWVQSILSFQIFLLLEPDSHRSKNAFEEMLQVMHIKETTEEPIERSFIQKQLERHANKNDSANTVKKNTPPLNTFQGVNRAVLYNAIENTKDSLKNNIDKGSLKNDTTNTFLYNSFKEVTRTVFTTLSEKNDGTQKGFIWNFHVPVITKIINSSHFNTFCRYISVAYFPESLEWWENNQEIAAKFVRWFEKGDEDE